jgi:hypothetical protein
MALTFNGSTGYLQWDKGGGSMPVTAFPYTMLCWFSETGGSGFRHAAMLQAAGNNWFSTMGVNSSDQANTQEYDGTTFGDVPYTGSPNPDSTMQLIVAVCTSASSRRIYWVDSTRTSTDSTSLTDRVSGFDRITVGARNANNNLIQFLQGDVAELHFYSAALSGANVDSIAGGTKPEDIANWADGWQLKTTSDLTSMSGSRTLTLNGGVTTASATHPVDRSGGGSSVFNPLTGRGAAAAFPFASLREALTRRPRIFLPPLFRPSFSG